MGFCYVTCTQKQSVASHVHVGLCDVKPGSDRCAGQIVLVELHHARTPSLHSVGELVLELDVTCEGWTSSVTRLEDVVQGWLAQQLVTVHRHLELQRRHQRDLQHGHLAAVDGTANQRCLLQTLTATCDT